MENPKYSVHILDQTELIQRIEGITFGLRPQYTAIVFVKKGNISFLANGEQRMYGGQEMFFISNRNTYESFKTSEDIQLYVVVNDRDFRNSFSFKFNQFELFKIIAIDLRNAIKIPEEEQKIIWSLLENMHQLYVKRKNDGFDVEILMHLQASLIYLVVSIIHATSNRKILSFNNRKELLTSKFIELAFNSFIQEKEMKYYADKLFVSIKYLSICVKEITGYPPTYILNQLSLYEARIKLSDNFLSIAQVAEDLGFTDQYVFSKFFKKHMGVSPLKFRKQAQNSLAI